MPLHLDEPLTERSVRIVRAAKLHRRAERRKAGSFLIEGPNAVEMALDTNLIRDIFVTADGLDRFYPLLEAADVRGVHCHLINDRAAKNLADTVTTAGLFAVCDNLDFHPDKLDMMDLSVVLVAVETSDPGNAGTLIRLADAFGVDAVVFAGECVDPLNGKVVRASAGSVFNIPIVHGVGVGTAIGILKDRGLAIAATAADGAVGIRSEQGSALCSQPVAWLVGNEAHGLAPAVLTQADAIVSLPIPGRAESLNVAAAAAVCLWESTMARGGDTTATHTHAPSEN